MGLIREMQVGMRTHGLRSRSGGRRAACCLAAAALALGTGCGGGGGGDGGGAGRTTGTGLRILHGATDIEPVDLRIGEQLLQRAKFGDTPGFVEADKGPQKIALDRANALGTTVASLDATLEDKVEYSLLLFGRETSGTFSVKLLPEPVVRPESGRARLQLVHALEGAGAITATWTGAAGAPSATTEPAQFSLSSGFIDVPFGPGQVTVKNSRGGTLFSVNVDIPDRGEATVLAFGVTDLGVTLGRVVLDLD